MSFLEPQDLPDPAATEEFLRQLARDMATKRAQALQGDERNDAFHQALEYVENYHFPEVPRGHVRFYRMEFHPDFIQYRREQREIEKLAAQEKRREYEKRLKFSRFVKPAQQNGDDDDAEIIKNHVSGVWYLLDPALDCGSELNRKAFPFYEFKGLRFYASMDGGDCYYGGRLVVIDVPEADVYTRAHETPGPGKFTTQDFNINGIARVDQVAELYYPGTTEERIGLISRRHQDEYIDVSQGKYPKQELFPKLNGILPLFELKQLAPSPIEIKSRQGSPEYI
jgi:hypothetical protein